MLSLGSIAHLQYYFARTGLLDGKGAQLAREEKKKRGVSDGALGKTPRIYLNPEARQDEAEMMSNTDGDDNASQDWDSELMLPPTVSTYSQRIQYLPPPKDSDTLRKELKSALRQAEQALREVQSSSDESVDRSQLSDSSPTDQLDLPEQSTASVQPSAWDEIQGLHILDVVTLAIRAAKIFYTAHEDPQRLYSIKSERQIREELLAAMDVLKRMASRNFAGGMKDDEVKVVKGWIEGIEQFIMKEQELERQEAKDRENWQWLDGSWSGREREREWSFLCSFLPNTALPEWTTPAEDGTPTAFLQSLQNGLTLVHLHNAILKKSKRQFGEIKTFHTDTAKPYRCAENLRYWIKAAEIRWETKLQVDVTGIVHSKPQAWATFDLAILQWCRAVREEITKEWRQGSLRETPSSEGAY